MQKALIGTIAIFFQFITPAFACLPAAHSQQQGRATLGDATSKITFDFSDSADGVQPISYEFCIPADEQHLAEVQSIDPTIVHFAHSRGRIGCRRDQYLCIGGRTRDAQWRSVLLSIARLEYVDRIDQFFGE